jgi:hypothetical protein
LLRYTNNAKGSVGSGGNQKYPDVWPFGEPFDPPKSSPGKTIMNKLRGLFGAIAVALASAPGAAFAQTQLPPNQAPATATVSQEQKQPLIYVKHLEPPLGYPPLARQTRVGGTVTMKLDISPNGRVLSVESSPNDGPTGVSGLLRPDAERVIRTWTFGCVGCAPDTPFEHTIRFRYILCEDLAVQNKVTLNLPDEVIVLTGPVMCDHCGGYPVSSKKEKH